MLPRIGIVTLLWLIALHVSAATLISGRIVGVYDGDSATLLTGSNDQVKIRLAEIDAPEKKQPYGNRSKQALSDLIFGKQVTARVVTIDRYGRTVARLYVGDVDVSREMVRAGAAWVYRQYNQDTSLLDVEADARRARRGLWGLPETERQEPWLWRRK